MKGKITDDMAITLTVLYSCDQCGLKDQLVQVPERAEKDNVGAWFENTVIPCLSRDHQAHSPNCHPRTLQDIKIPIAENGGIGKPVGH